VVQSTVIQHFVLCIFRQFC